MAEGLPVARRLTLIVVLAAASFSSGFILGRNRASIQAPSPPHIPPCPHIYENIEIIHTLGEGDTLSDVLDLYRVDGRERSQFIESLRGCFDPNRLRAGRDLRLLFEPPGMSLRSLTYEIDDETTLLVRDTGSFTSEIKKIELTVEWGKVEGVIIDNLWNSALQAGMGPKDIIALSEIFEWDIDFNTELRRSDSFRAVVEEKYHRGNLYKLGRILGAKLINQGRPFYGIYFETGDGKKGYYDLEGRSVQKAFLRSPIKYSRVTSGFSNRRFHPILKRYRPHPGIDYGAPPGTPVRAVGSGTVTLAGWNGSSGKMVKIRHNNVYSSAYCHLKGFVRGLRKGKKVQQGEVVGYVGSTGLATGPHLHFAFYKYGTYVNFLGMKFPPSEPVPPDDMGRFEEVKSKFLALSGEG